jgi:hypothetical protein
MLPVISMVLSNVRFCLLCSEVPRSNIESICRRSFRCILVAREQEVLAKAAIDHETNPSVGRRLLCQLIAMYTCCTLIDWSGWSRDHDQLKSFR